MPAKNLAHFSRLTSKIRQSILNETNLISALVAARLYGDIRWVNYDGIYADDELEVALTERVRKLCTAELTACKTGIGKGVLLLASELYDHGGHTAVVKKWLRLMSKAIRHTLIVTRSITDKCMQDPDLANVRIIKCDGNEIASIKTILREALGKDTVVLHIHPDDIGSAVAARLLKEMGYLCVFYNHADHVFSYGIGAADMVCEISTFGKAINDRCGRVLGSSINLGVPLSTPPNFASMSAQPRQSRVLTCGAAYKYKPAGELFFGDFVDTLFSLRPDAEIVFIGSTGKESWWQNKLAAWGRRVKFLGELPSSDYEKELRIADIYVDSYPVTGGTAFPEALLMGKACAALANPCQGYSYADELRDETVQQLAQRVNKLLEKDTAEIARLERVRRKVASFQSEDAFKTKIERIYKRNLSDPNNANDMADMLGDQKHDEYWFEKTWRTQGKVILPYVSKSNAIRMSLAMRIKFICVLSQSLSFCKPRQLISLIRSLLIGWKHPLMSAK